MSALLESFAQRWAELPAPLRAAADLGEARKAALEAMLADGLPAQRAERWRYTNLRALGQRSYRASAGASVDAALIAHIPRPRLVFVNGWLDTALSDLSDLPVGLSVRALGRVLPEAHARDVAHLGRRYMSADEVFARANAALAVEGAVIEVEADARIEAHLHLVAIGAPESAEAAWHLRHLIDLGANARLILVEHVLGFEAHGHLDNTIAQVHLKPGAELTHARLQSAAEGAQLFARVDAALAAGALYRRVDLELGAALSRLELNAELQGEAAAFVSGGAQLVDAKRAVDVRLAVDHVARDTRCDLRWRGLAAGRGKLSFYGGIRIREGADGTDAELSDRNLLLSDTAEVNTQPVLVIDADEVKAAHGATVGQLDAAALFYLRSRGIPRDEARALLTRAFLVEAIEVGEQSALIETLTDALIARIEGAAL
ncbi:Fe-S cluster assembly protein SufD [Aquimonas voraii]|uniref:Iron-regulated ABC transporter permease protein SufD n=1 Tax=Aquimonas voraii TaxID=265719 RepID=A0A1G6TV44_9GAMM|nr:Fe-S cluster assembly protein SufD [Aquimonas voraii]SDD32911.1 Iron-regulated ABC transporter permease protein SufD [Aquimonas voraii]